jgi:hypothetical protein
MTVNSSESAGSELGPNPSSAATQPMAGEPVAATQGSGATSQQPPATQGQPPPSRQTDLGDQLEPDHSRPSWSARSAKELFLVSLCTGFVLVLTYTSHIVGFSLVPFFSLILLPRLDVPVAPISSVKATVPLSPPVRYGDWSDSRSIPFDI